MKLTTSVTTPADLDSAWAAITDVTDWPHWTASISDVTLIDDGPLHLGSRARVKQPGMQTLTWAVTELADKSEFTWVTKSPGVRTDGRHKLGLTDDGSHTRITLELEQTGPLAGLIRLLMGKRSERYLGLEAAGLKAAAEDVAARR
jgi:uncharacterized membrane protein